jgi:hypothetical protein
VTLDADAPVASPFRWRLAHRPDTRFGHAAGGVAGVLVVAAMVAFAAAIDNDDPQVAGSLFSIAVLVAAVFAGYWKRGPIRSAAVTAIVLAFPLLWIFAVIGDGKGVGRSDVRLVFILITVSYVAMYLLTWTRGRGVLLGGALFVAATWLVSEVADDAPRFGISGPFGSSGLDNSNLFGDDGGRSVAVVMILIGVGFLGATALLDRSKRHGLATPFLVVGAIYAIVGAYALGIDTDADHAYAAGICLALAGLAIGAAGIFGDRRATSWLGAIVLLVGAVTVVAQGTEDSATGGGGEELFGLFALIAAAVLLVLGILVARTADEPLDGGEPVPDTPPPPPEPSLIAAVPETPVAETPVAETPATEPPADA